MKSTQDRWTCADAARLFRVDGWGDGLFRVGPQGHMQITLGAHGVVDLRDVMERMRARGFVPPVVLAFPQVIQARMERLYRAFQDSMVAYDYPGSYRYIYPLKVNPQRSVVEAVLAAGTGVDLPVPGLEVGSRPELHIALSLLQGQRRPIVHNGHKDRDSLRMAMLGCRLGQEIIVVIEKPHEVPLLLELAEEMGVRPRIGLRLKPATIGAGRWQGSTGVSSKLGLGAQELLAVLDHLRQRGFLECVVWLHGHIGSQVPDLDVVRAWTAEAAHTYIELRRHGCPVETVDLGGGLGVSYTGDNPHGDGIPYTVEEYAGAIVRTLHTICTQAQVPCPHIVTESGRFLAAHHTVLVVNVVATNTVAVHTSTAAPSPFPALAALEQVVARGGAMACDLVSLAAWVDQTVAALARGIGNGTLHLADRARVEAVLQQLHARIPYDHVPEILSPDAARHATEPVLGNFSVFQSLPDSWALEQVFPVVPLQRLTEAPTRRVAIHDLTCDSDGRLHRFGHGTTAHGIRPDLPLHTIAEDESYDLGIFLTGAYQTVLGGLHNLFGRPHMAEIVATEADAEQMATWEITRFWPGQTSSGVLQQVLYAPDRLRHRLQERIRQFAAVGDLAPEEADMLAQLVQDSFQETAYLS